MAEFLAFTGCMLAPDLVAAEFAALEGVGFCDGVDDAWGRGCYGFAVGISARTCAYDEETELFLGFGRG